jgi:NADH-quinone oxidoreductase subunit H
MQVLNIIISLILFPGMLFTFIMAALLGWIRSMGRALVFGWSGAAPSFSYRELLRRIRQSSTLPEGTNAFVIQGLVVVALLCPLFVLVFLPLPGNRGLGTTDYTLDIAAISALLLGVPIARFVLGLLIPSPYTRIAASRNIKQLLGYIVPLVLSVGVAVALRTTLSVAQIVNQPLKSGLNLYVGGLALIFAGITFATCIPTIARITPIHEGMGMMELAGSEYTELSGRELLAMRIAESMQFVATVGLGIVLFVLPFFTGDVTRLLVTLIAFLMAAGIVGISEGLIPRLRAMVDDGVAPISIWLGTPTVFGIVTIFILVMAQRFA